jgi:hypothetical protein
LSRVFKDTTWGRLFFLEGQLTFNTTSLPLWSTLQNKSILERLPLKPAGDQKRHLLVAPEIDALLDGHMFYGLFPDICADRLIATYSTGWLVTVSRKITKRKPDIERIEGYDEVWALCPRRPPPGWRILGRFYEKDTFVALRAWEKNRLFRNYSQAAREVIEDWEALLGEQPPHRGTSVGDYLSEVFRDVDEED